MQTQGSSLNYPMFPMPDPMVHLNQQSQTQQQLIAQQQAYSNQQREMQQL